MSWYMINNYLMLFYTDILTLSAGAISLIMLIARIWDAINDPMMGNITDRTRTRWGKFRPYIMFASPFLAIFNILTFTVFPVEGAAKFLLCLVCYIGAGMAYTACSIPYQALQNVCAIDSRVRMNLATARGVGSSVIGIILSIVAAPLLLKFSNAGATAADAKGYFTFTILLSIIMIPVFWLCAAGCKENYTEKLHNGTEEKVGFFKAMKSIAKNDQLLLIVITTVLGTICVSGRMGLLTYYVIYVVGEFSKISIVFTVMTIAQLIGTCSLPLLTKYFSKKTCMIGLNVIMIFGFLGIYLFGERNFGLFLVLSFICGLCNASSSLCYGLVADSIEYGAWKLGTRQEGVAASMLSFGVKVATAICGSAGVLLLSAAGYVANAEQTAAAKQGINFVVNMVPLIIAVISLIPLFFYKLTPKRVQEIREDLEAGRGPAAEKAAEQN